jgi:hypothetical protein
MYTIKNGKIKSNWHLEDMQTLMQQFAQSSSPENFKLYSNVSNKVLFGDGLTKNVG